MTYDVEVAGLGVSGSLLALRLAERGFRVLAYEPVQRYEKACGEQITLEPRIEGLVRSLDVIKTIVRSVDVYVDGALVTTVELKGSPRWAIVDKPRLVNELRKEAERAGVSVVRSVWKGLRQAAIAVDARGPYTVVGRGPTVLALRLIARVSRWNPEEAWLDFRPSQGGLYWVFPYDADGKLINAGVGLLGVNDVDRLRGLAISYLKERLGEADVIDYKGAPIAAFAHLRLASGRDFWVGEAAGLVMAWSGEGNRPALLSSLALSEAIGKVGVEDHVNIRVAYERSVGDLAKMATVARALTLAAVSMRSSGELMTAAPKWFWESYVKQDISQAGVLRALVSALRAASNRSQADQPRGR
ncbi:MAG: NAD(P)-binding domain-containing protein [Acidilobus sp.]